MFVLCIPGRASVIRGVLFSAVILLTWVSGARAQADPGDYWVFGVDSPVAREHTYSQYRPAVAGDYAFWEDNRPVPGSQTFPRVFFRDLSDPDSNELPLMPDASYFLNLEKSQGDPAADGNMLAWREAVPSPTDSRAYEIRYIDFGDGCLERGDCLVRRVPYMSTFELRPTVSGPVIVWQDEPNGAAEADIYMFDSRTGAVTAVCAEPGRQQAPDVGGDWVVWVDNRGGEYIRGRMTRNDLYIRNVVTGEERRITNDEDAGLQDSPAISGDVVVYSQDLQEPTRGDIIAYRISTGETWTVYAGEGFDQRPDIDGGSVVWEACPEGIDRCGIWLHDLGSGVSQPVSDGPRDGGGYDGAGAGLPAVSAGTGRVVWQDSRGGGRAIYQNRPGSRARELAERYRPELRLSVDEQFQPEPMELMLQLPGSFLRKWPNDGFEPVRNPGVAELAAGCGGECYIDLMGSAVEAGGGESSCDIDRGVIARTYREYYLVMAADFPPTVYARVKPVAGGAVVQYWINYPVNDHPRLFHEGDWEMVQVRLDGDLRPYRADYSQHGGGQWRQWSDVEMAGSGDNPVVYVAVGSHASYFRAGEFDLIPYFAWDFADGRGAELKPRVQVIPEADEAEGTFAWLAAPVRWGEQTGANLCLPGVPGVFSPEGHRDGPPGPAFQGAKWDDPLGWLSEESCDGCEARIGEGAVLGVSAWSGLDVNLYDSSGNHFGRNADGGLDREIVGAYSLEYSEDGQTILQVPAADAADEFLVKLNGTPAGPVVVTVPYHDDGVVDTLTFTPYTASRATTAWLFLDVRRDYRLWIDYDGDGVSDAAASPEVITSRAVDYLAPEAVTDLRAKAVDAGTILLDFTAPGDDGDQGTAAAYDLRYSLRPIDASSWPDATRVSALKPSPAGTAESVTVDGLLSGTTYYFAIRGVDDAALSAPLSNVAMATTSAPALVWSRQGSSWKSYDDYRARRLTVGYTVYNKGTGTAFDVRVEESLAFPATIYAMTPLPIDAGDIESGTGVPVEIAYHVPGGFTSFVATTYASCRDSEGEEFWFPEPLEKT